MRLIDADKFKKQVATMAVQGRTPADKSVALMAVIDAQPIAYDVEKVTNQLKNYSERIHKGNSRFGMFITTDTAIEIVKAGG